VIQRPERMAGDYHLNLAQVDRLGKSHVYSTLRLVQKGARMVVFQPLSQVIYWLVKQ